jgi:hypothetical protein
VFHSVNKLLTIIPTVKFHDEILIFGIIIVSRSHVFEVELLYDRASRGSKRSLDLDYFIRVDIDATGVEGSNSALLARPHVP